MDLEYKELIESISSPFYATLVETWLKPKVEKKLINSGHHQDIDEMTKVFEEYLSRSYYKHMFIKTIVFNNNPKNLGEIYIPLTLENKEYKIQEKISDYPNNLMKEYNKIVITDSAGMGKSTLLKFMFLRAINLNKGVPIFIELRKLNNEHTVIDEIMKEINPINSNVDKHKILDLISEGDFIFFLDGYDEIPLHDKANVTSDLEGFIDKAYKNSFILSSRPQTEVTAFNNFQEFSIMRLSKEEAYKLLSKYDTKKVLVDRLINELELKRNLNVAEFLENPLMVSLLFKAYEHKNILPFKKNIFYRQVYDALYNEHDLSKGGSFEHEKKCKLDSDKFHTVLRTLGFLTLKDNIIAYSKDQIIDYLNKSSMFSNIEFQPSLFLSDLILTVPLFTREGIEYKWNHKSFQEYFAAQFICKDAKEKQKDILINMYNSDNFVSYLNVLDLCYDIDYKTFRNVIIYSFLNEIINYSEEFDIRFKKINKFRWKQEDYLKMKYSLFLSENYLVTNQDSIKEIQESNNKKTVKQNIKDSHSIFKNALDYLTSHSLDGSPKYPVTFIRTIQNSSVNEKGIECDKTFLFVSANSNKKYFIRFLIDKKENIFYKKVKKKKNLQRNFNLFKIDLNRSGNYGEINESFKSIKVDCQNLNLDFLATHNKFADLHDYLEMVVLPSKIYGTKLFDFELIEAYKNSIESEMKEYNVSDLTNF